MDSSQQQSRELLRLYDRYKVFRSYIAEDDSDKGPLGDLDWTSPDLADPQCAELGLDPRSGPTAYADVTNDGVEDAIVTLSCDVSTGGYPEHIRLFDGASPAGRPRALADLPLDANKVDLGRAVTIRRVYASPFGVLAVYSGRSAVNPDEGIVVAVTEYRWKDGQLQRIE